MLMSEMKNIGINHTLAHDADPPDFLVADHSEVLVGHLGNSIGVWRGSTHRDVFVVLMSSSNRKLSSL